MAARTLGLHKAKYPLTAGKSLLSFKQDKEIIYFEQIGEKSTSNGVPGWLQLKRAAAQQVIESKPVESVSAVTETVKAAPVAVPVAAAAKPSGGKVSADRPVSAFETLQVLLAIKLKKSLGEISSESSIKDLVGGKSAIQNEILGDLQKEFGVEPENAAALPLCMLFIGNEVRVTNIYF